MIVRVSYCTIQSDHIFATPTPHKIVDYDVESMDELDAIISGE